MGSTALAKKVAKLFAICALAMAVIIASIALSMKLFGKDLLKGFLSGMFGREVSFESISVNLDESRANFRGFGIVSEIGFEKDVFNAEKVTVMIDGERFQKDRTIRFDEIFIRKGILNIERNENGAFNIVNLKRPVVQDARPAAHAEKQKKKGLYDFAQRVKKVTIEDSIITFKDTYVPRGPFDITCERFHLTFISGQEPDPDTGYIPVTLNVEFRIPNERHADGNVSLDARIASYEDKTDMDAKLATSYIDLMRFLPYFESYTPFSFRSGIFSSDTHFEIHERMVRGPTTMVFHRLDLLVDPGMERAAFLTTSVDRLVPYLQSSQGEIVFDFFVEGPIENPKIGIGPKVKFAIGMLVIEELGNLFGQLQNLQ
jgi:hypothetical protein